MLPALASGDAFHYPGLPVLNILSTIGYTLKPAATTTTTGTFPAAESLVFIHVCFMSVCVEFFTHSGSCNHRHSLACHQYVPIY